MNTGVGCHSLLQGNPHDPGIEPISLNVSYIIAGGFFTTALPRKPDISSWLDLNCASLVDTSQRWDCVLYGIIMCGAGLWIVPSLDKMAFARLLHQETTLLLSVINMYFLKLCLFIYLFGCARPYFEAAAWKLPVAACESSSLTRDGTRDGTRDRSQAPAPPCWELGVPATGPPEKSQYIFWGRNWKHPISHQVLNSVWIHDFLFYSMGYVCTQSLSCVWFSVALWTVAHQAPLSMGFSRQEYWSGLPRDQTWISCISCIGR